MSTLTVDNSKHVVERVTLDLPVFFKDKKAPLYKAIYSPHKMVVVSNYSFCREVTYTEHVFFNMDEMEVITSDEFQAQMNQCIEDIRKEATIVQ